MECTYRGPRGKRGHRGKSGSPGPPGIMGATGPTGASGLISGVTYYFNPAVTSDIPNYDNMSMQPLALNETTIETPINSSLGEVNFVTFITNINNPGTVLIPGGIWNLNFYANIASFVAIVNVFYRIFIRSLDGTETFYFRSSDIQIDSIAPILFINDSVVTSLSVANTDRIVIKFYVTTNSFGTQFLTTYYQGIQHYSHIHTPLEFQSGAVGNTGPTGPFGIGPTGPINTSLILYTVTNVSSSLTLPIVQGEEYVQVDPTSGAISIILPAISSYQDKKKKLSILDTTGAASSTNTITVTASPGEAINGSFNPSPGFIINTPRSSISIYSDYISGINWYIW